MLLWHNLEMTGQKYKYSWYLSKYFSFCVSISILDQDEPRSFGQIYRQLLINCIDLVPINILENFKNS